MEFEALSGTSLSFSCFQAKKYHFWRDKKMGVAQLGLDAKSDAKQQQALHARQRAAEKNKARLDAKGR